MIKVLTIYRMYQKTWSEKVLSRLNKKIRKYNLETGCKTLLVVIYFYQIGLLNRFSKSIYSRRMV